MYSSKSEAEYLERVKKLYVEEYINQVVLGDGWQYPLQLLIPVGLDEVWMNFTGAYSVRDAQSLRAQRGFATPLKVQEQLPYEEAQRKLWGITDQPGVQPFGSMSMLVVTKSARADHVCAAYHPTFPIHRMDAQSAQELALALRTSWKSLDTDEIDYSCVYRRPAAPRAPSSSQKDWTPVDHGARSVDELSPLSPLDQVRILVV